MSNRVGHKLSLSDGYQKCHNLSAVVLELCLLTPRTVKRTLNHPTYSKLKKMGLPDLPGQPEKDDTFTVDENHTIHVEPFSEDESDNESVGDNHGYAGYQPLNVDELTQPHHRLSPMEDNFEDGMDIDLNGSSESDPQSNVNTDLLNVDVWNAPRPNELSIDIDPTKAAEIVNVMAAIKLPTTAVPEWARGVPEEEWKENLLQRIRQRQQPEVVDGSLKSAAPAPQTTNENSVSSCCQKT